MRKLVDVEEFLVLLQQHAYPVVQRHNSTEPGMTLNGIRQVLDEMPSAEQRIVEKLSELPVYYDNDYSTGNTDPLWKTEDVLEVLEMQEK
jgi:hypothetical protein